MCRSWSVSVLVGWLSLLGCAKDSSRPDVVLDVTHGADVVPDASDEAVASDAVAETGPVQETREDGRVDGEVDAEDDAGGDADVSSGVDADAHAQDGESEDMAVADIESEIAADNGDTASEPSDAVDAVDVVDAVDAVDAVDVVDAVDAVDAVVVEPISDTLFGVVVPRASSWWVADGRIHRGNAVVRLRGVNWFGLETPDRALHGTWFGRTVDDFLAELRALGFDSLRIPLSPESINPGFASASWADGAYVAGPARSGREHLERLIAAAEAADFTLLLDFHTCNPSQLGGALPGRPDGCPGYDVERWLADLTTLAALAAGHEHVLGIDLTNEPHALTWAAWKALAERGAEAVLRANPRLLVFVEGVAGASEFGGYYPFWGGNLTEAASALPAIPPARLVFSPHVYGPGISAQAYFGAANFPANMPAIWHAHFGHLVPRFALACGEFGGHYDDSLAQGEVAWNEAYVAYLATLDRGQPASFYYWAVNPNSGDTGGLYLDDWVTLVPRRLALLAPLLGP